MSIDAGLTAFLLSLSLGVGEEGGRVEVEEGGKLDFAGNECLVIV